jgi:hypothetical protein
MAYVSVDVDLDDLDTDDIVEECVRRLKKESGRKALTKAQKDELIKSFFKLSEYFKTPLMGDIEIKTLEDKMKSDLLVILFNKYTLNELQMFDLAR